MKRHVRKGTTQPALRVHTVRSDCGESARPVKLIEKIPLFMQQDMLRQIIRNLQTRSARQQGGAANRIKILLNQQIAAQPVIDASPSPNSDVDVFAPAIR